MESLLAPDDDKSLSELRKTFQIKVNHRGKVKGAIQGRGLIRPQIGPLTFFHPILMETI